MAVLAAGTLVFLNLNGKERPDRADSKGSPPAKSSPAADPTQSRELLNVPAPAQIGEVSNDADGSWLTSRSYAAGAPYAVLGYDLDTGKQSWKVPLDGDLCAASQDVTSKGLVAVVFRESVKNRRCTKIAVIDINRGRKVWQKSLPERKGNLGLDLNVGISEELAAVGWPGETWGFAVDSGETVWDSPQPGCQFEEQLGVKKLMSLTYCGDHFEVSSHDARSGKPSRVATLPKGLGWTWLASADPLVVAAYVGDTEFPADANRLLTFDKSGTLKATIKIDGYVPGCRDGGTCGAVVATKDSIYLASKRKTLTSGDHIAAFDTSTGKRKWTVDGTDRAEMLPMRSDENGLVAYSSAGPTRDGSGVVHLAAADGKQTQLLRLPNGFAVSNMQSQLAGPGMDQPILYQDGRLFFHLTSGFDIWHNVPMNVAFTTHGTAAGLGDSGVYAARAAAGVMMVSYSTGVNRA
ncbi:PQQ-binding-like beta-propeller repeat protein, partial [Streptomyces sp. NPDC001933]|uniref:outer membrane protein assembly factor BamB family protein n=1 Tax=Streptomyces sp. NPDC001933 TaxID=3364626 RepID=UPI00367F77C3